MLPGAHGFAVARHRRRGGARGSRLYLGSIPMLGRVGAENCPPDSPVVPAFQGPSAQQARPKRSKLGRTCWLSMRRPSVTWPRVRLAPVKGRRRRCRGTRAQRAPLTGAETSSRPIIEVGHRSAARGAYRPLFASAASMRAERAVSEANTGGSAATDHEGIVGEAPASNTSLHLYPQFR